MRHALRHPSRRGAREILTLVLKTAAVAIFLAAILAFPAFTQQPAHRTLELSASGRYTDFAPDLGLQSGVGGGFRLGYFVLPRWQLEGGVGLARVDRMSATETVNVVPVLLDVTYNVPVGVHELLLGGGAVYNKYGPSHAWGTSVTAGFRVGFGSAAALRVDGSREYMNKRGDVARHSNWGFRLGLSWVLAQRPVLRDSVAINGGASARVVRSSLPLVRAADVVAIDMMSMTLHFDVGSAAIRGDAFGALDAKLRLLQGVPALRIRVEGQADARGPTADNIALAWERAGAAKLWLTNHGISANRIDAVGFAEGRPRCVQANESCPWRNRAELLIVAGADVHERNHR